MSEEASLHGIAASSGIAFGKAFLFANTPICLPCREVQAGPVEFERFLHARQEALAELQSLRAQVLARTGKDDLAAIFDAQLSMAMDPELESEIQMRCDQGEMVEAAVQGAIQMFSDLLAGMGDELFAARALDVKDVGERILRRLLGLPNKSLDSLSEPSIIIARDLAPSDTANLDPELVRGFATAAGGLTSHTSILARTLGLPAVVGLGEGLLCTVCDGDELILGGDEGVLVVHPAGATRQRYLAQQSQAQARFTFLAEKALQKAHSADGRRVEVAANVGSLDSTADALKLGAEGIGLLRTEFLYLEHTAPPSEAEQFQVYRAILERMGDRPVIIRTLDIGGDKPPSYLQFGEELNPFLGWRAIRICLDDIPLFKVQLRSILRAAAGYNASIMFPMISAVEELRQAKAVLAEVHAELDREGLEYNRAVPVGIMVETPAAAALSDALARECDFFSLGTNDLTQYTLAVDRGNERIGKLYQPLHPAVLRLIHATIQGAHRHGKWVGMCGELAGMPKAIPILLGMGLDEFSMAPRAIPEAKWLIGQLDSSQAAQIAADVLQMATVQEIEDYLEQNLTELMRRS